MTAIVLLTLDHAAAESLAGEPSIFAERHGLVLAPHESTAVGIARATAGFLATNGAVLPWCGYLALVGPLRRVAGTCGFKGGPDADRAVEIAYFTFPGEEGRGVATEMARALVRMASTAELAIAVVRAHTLPERNASCRVLEKLGFSRADDVIDPEDGPVWRWEQRVVNTL